MIADPHSLDDATLALEALRALASLPERQRADLALKVAGYSYDEIRVMTGGRTLTNLNKSLVKAQGSHPSDPPTRLLNDATRGGQITPSPLL